MATFGLRRRPSICAMNGTRTRAWWVVRLELLVGIVLTLLVARLGFEAAMTVRIGGNPPAHVLPLPPHAMLFLGGLAISIVGLVWMVRIIRGPREDPAPGWRYREVPWHDRDR